MGIGPKVRVGISDFSTSMVKTHVMISSRVAARPRVRIRVG